MGKSNEASRETQIMDILKESDPETQRLALALAIGLCIVDKLDDVIKAVNLLKSIIPPR